MTVGHHKRKRGVAPMAAVVPNGVSLLEHSTHLLGPVTQLLIWKMGFFFFFKSRPDSKGQQKKFVFS